MDKQTIDLILVFAVFAIVVLVIFWIDENVR